MALPEACAACGANGGYWAQAKQGGMERCGCPRGLALLGMERKAIEPLVARPPVISSEEATCLAEMLAGNYGFSLGQAVPLIASEIRDMADGFVQAREFVRRFVRLYKKWPGIDEMRWAFYQMGFRPLDAIAPASDSEFYPKGMPKSAGGRGAPALEAPRDPRSRELPPGEAGEIVRLALTKKAV
jgi:hypothetical protein